MASIQDKKHSIAVVGSGRAGYNLAHKLDQQKALVLDVDFEASSLTCAPAFEDLQGRILNVKFDTVILAPECKTNDFSTSGLEQYAFYVKTVSDAMAVRSRLSDILEIAALPDRLEAEQRRLLHIVIVGGGPTGIEMAAEMSDLVNGDLCALYPELKDKMSITAHDVAPQILNPYDRALSEYATQSSNRHKVQTKTNSHITNVTETYIKTKEDGKIGYGMLIWATGNKSVSLVDGLKVSTSQKGMKRILTDEYLRVLAKDGTVMSNVFSLGDAADIEGGSLPTTAEVAVQKADYLRRVLNARPRPPAKAFKYQQRRMVTCTGGKDGVMEGKLYDTGRAAWLSWRSGNLSWARSSIQSMMIKPCDATDAEFLVISTVINAQIEKVCQEVLELTSNMSMLDCRYAGCVYTSERVPHLFRSSGFLGALWSHSRDSIESTGLERRESLLSGILKPGKGVSSLEARNAVRKG